MGENASADFSADIFDKDDFQASKSSSADESLISPASRACSSSLRGFSAQSLKSAGVANAATPLIPVSYTHLTLPTILLV